MKKLICLLTVFVSLFFMQVPVKASDINWDISKSKTATQLDEKLSKPGDTFPNYKSKPLMNFLLKVKNLFQMLFLF